MTKPSGNSEGLNLRYARWLTVICFCLHLGFSLVGWKNSILDRYGFRQSQTAITAYYFIQDGLKLVYETPVLGAPWSIPMEFPLYQGITALASKTTGCNLDQTGRAVSLLFFYAALGVLYLLISRLLSSRICGHLAVSLTLICPLYIFWSRTFMIESTALFFSLLYLLGVVSALKNKSSAWGTTAVLAGTTAGLVKITTFTVALPLAGLFCLFWWINQNDQRFSAKTIRLLAFMALAYALIPLAAATAWTLFADSIKAQHPAGGFLVSKNLAVWNFGTLQQKLDPAYWHTLINRSLPYIIPLKIKSATVLWPWIIGLFGVFAYFAGKNRLLFFSFLAAFVAGPLVYTNLYFEHEYYWFSNTLYLLIAIALVIDNLLRHPAGAAIGRWILIPALVCFMIHGYMQILLPYQRRDARRSFINTAQLIRQHTDSNAVLLCYGLDWDSSLPYYAQRRALMIKESEFLNLEDAFRQTGETNIQALVLSSMYPVNQESVETSLKRLHLSPVPIISQNGIHLYVRNPEEARSPAPDAPGSTPF